MRRTALTLLLTALMMAGGLVIASPASACSCLPQTTQQYFDGADAVFTGQLVSREEPPGPISSSADPALHLFAVDTVFEGTAHEQQEVLSPMSGATCGLELSGKGPFVVFATRSSDLGGGMQFTTLDDDQYAAFLCGGTAPLTPALEAELQALGPASAPLPAPSPAPTPTPTPTPADPAATDPEGAGLQGPVIAVAAVLALAVGGAALAFRRRRVSGRGPG